MARKEKKYHFIYKTTCVLNGKYYYGMHSTDNLDDGYYGSGRRLRRSLNKHGKENHVVEIIEFLPDRKSLINRENVIINLNEIAKENCMNLRVGGTGGLSGLSDKTIQKIREGASNFLKKMWKNDDYRKKQSILSGEKMKKSHKLGKIKYDTFTGKSHTIETKQKISETKRGTGTNEKNSQFGTCWITKDNLNKKIKTAKIDDYLKLGWLRGRKMK